MGTVPLVHPWSSNRFHPSFLFVNMFPKRNLINRLIKQVLDLTAIGFVISILLKNLSVRQTFGWIYADRW